MDIIADCTVCDHLLIACDYRHNFQPKMSDAEGMTTTIVAALYFGGNHQTARQFFKGHGFIPKMLRKSGFKRRLHYMQPIFLSLSGRLAQLFKDPKKTTTSPRTSSAVVSRTRTSATGRTSTTPTARRTSTGRMTGGGY